MKPDGLKIWERMQEKRLTKVKLSRAAHMRERTLTRAMAGFNVSSSTATAIATALEVSVNELRKQE